MNNLTVEKIGKIKWRLTKRFTMCGITVPKGYETDLATVVRTWARDADEAAVIHDYMLDSGKYPRRVCDEKFYEVMLKTHVGPKKAKLMFIAVRVYGIIKIVSRGIYDAFRRT